MTAALFVYTTAAGSGEVRLYLILGVLAGAAPISAGQPLVLKGGYAAADLVTILWKILTFPLVFWPAWVKKSKKTQKNPSIIAASGIK